jgi:hypothetical protein
MAEPYDSRDHPWHALVFAVIAASGVILIATAAYFLTYWLIGSV